MNPAYPPKAHLEVIGSHGLVALYCDVAVVGGYQRVHILEVILLRKTKHCVRAAWQPKGGERRTTQRDCGALQGHHPG